MKTKIKVILIDDETKALESLRLKVTKFYPEIEIIEALKDPKIAIKKINELQPDLVFIDVEMPVYSGFDVLSKINNPTFETIFVTAYNNYAVEAIQYCAIGYVIKPIDNDELKQAVNNALKNINQKTAFEKNRQLLAHLGNSSNQKSIAIPTQKGLSFLRVENIIRFEGVDGYTKIIINNEKPILSSYNIGKFNKMLTESNFFLCHKSHLINLDYVNSILKEGSVLFNDNTSVPCSKLKRSGLLNRMQSL